MCWQVLHRAGLRIVGFSGIFDVQNSAMQSMGQFVQWRMYNGGYPCYQALLSPLLINKVDGCPRFPSFALVV